MKKFFTQVVSVFLAVLVCFFAFTPVADAASTYKETKIACTECDGTGKRVCSICDGTGKRTSRRSSSSTQCYLCKGSGRRGTCQTCKGTGYTVKYVSSVSNYSTPKENTFVGTINNKNVVGYLDDTYKYHIDGETEYNGEFVVYDKQGNALSKLSIAIDKGTGAKTYCPENNKSSVTLRYYPQLSKNYKWGSCYATSSSDDWTVTLSDVNYSDDGVFTGTVNAVLKPAKYGGSGLEGTVRVTGAFNLTMKEVHPTAKTYREKNSKYNAANPHDFNQYYNSGVEDSDSSSSTSPSSGSSTNKIDHTCRTCGGTRKCNGCAGRGWKISSATGKIIDCTRCHGTGTCQVCHGTGKVY